MTEDSKDPTISITKIPFMNTLVIKQDGRPFFITSRNSIVIDVPGLMFLLKFLLFNGLISDKALKGLLEEYDDHF